ncbi:hypothetical protein ACWDG1_50135, partial [Streptomyces sp. NPDC001177]
MSVDSASSGGERFDPVLGQVSQGPELIDAPHYQAPPPEAAADVEGVGGLGGQGRLGDVSGASAVAAVQGMARAVLEAVDAYVDGGEVDFEFLWFEVYAAVQRWGVRAGAEVLELPEVDGRLDAVLGRGGAQYREIRALLVGSAGGTAVGSAGGVPSQVMEFQDSEVLGFSFDLGPDEQGRLQDPDENMPDAGRFSDEADADMFDADMPDADMFSDADADGDDEVDDAEADENMPDENMPDAGMFSDADADGDDEVDDAVVDAVHRRSEPGGAGRAVVPGAGMSGEWPDDGPGDGHGVGREPVGVRGPGTVGPSGIAPDAAPARASLRQEGPDTNFPPMVSATLMDMIRNDTRGRRGRPLEAKTVHALSHAFRQPDPKWADLPEQYGSHIHVNQRFLAWAREGRFARWLEEMRKTERGSLGEDQQKLLDSDLVWLKNAAVKERGYVLRVADELWQVAGPYLAGAGGSEEQLRTAL